MVIKLLLCWSSFVSDVSACCFNVAKFRNFGLGEVADWPRHLATVRCRGAHRPGPGILQVTTTPLAASPLPFTPLPPLCARRGDIAAVSSFELVRRRCPASDRFDPPGAPPSSPLSPPPICRVNQAEVRAYWPVPPPPSCLGPRRSSCSPQPA